MFSSRILKFVVALLVVCQVGAWAKEVVLTEADKGGSFTLDVGDTVKVALAGNPTTGFDWHILNLSGKCLEKVGKEHKLSSPRCGAGGITTFTFKAKAQGESSLQLTYNRVWEKDIKPEKTFEVTLNVK